MKTTLVRWELLGITRHAPGVAGLFVICLLPAIQLLPWTRFGLFQSQGQASLVLTTVFALIAASSFAVNAGCRSARSFWLMQKGVAAEDAALAALAVASSCAVIATLVSAAWTAIGLQINSAFSFRVLLSCLGSGTLVVVVASVTVFFCNSFAVSRKSEFLILLFFISLLEPLLFMRAVVAVSRAAHLLLPPFSDVFRFVNAALAHDPRAAASNLMHIVAFSTVALTLAYWRQRHNFRA